MNERITLLALKASNPKTGWLDRQKFAELIVRECKENFAKVWYEQGVDCRGAELDKFMAQFDQHFGVEE
jgi:hypothetical protein